MRGSVLLVSLLVCVACMSCRAGFEDRAPPAFSPNTNANDSNPGDGASGGGSGANNNNATPPPMVGRFTVVPVPDEVGPQTEELVFDPLLTRFYLVVGERRLYTTPAIENGWNECPPLSSSIEILSIAVDPEDASHVVLGTDDGVLESSDGCETFAFTGPSENTPSVAFLSSGDVVIATLAGVYRRELGIWSDRSADIGNRPIASIAFAAGTVLAADSAGSVFRSEDSGLTYAETTDGTPSGRNFQILFDPIATDTAWLISSNGLFRSTNDGVTWSQTSSLVRRTFALHPTVPGVVIADSNEAALLSTDGGVSFPSTLGGIETQNGALNEVTFLPDGTVALSTDGGLYLANYPELSFRPTSTGIPAFDARELTASADDTIAVASPAGVVVVDGDGERLLWDDLDPSSMLTVELDPADSSRLLTGRVGLFRSTDGGQSFSVVFGTSLGQIRDIRCQQALCIAGARDGVARSTDFGETWTGTFLDDSVDDVRFGRDPNSTILGVNQGGIWRSIDQGLTWDYVTIGVPRLDAAEMLEDGSVIVTSRNGVFVGDSLTAAFQPTSIGGFCRDVIRDAEGRLVVGNSDGVFWTQDPGGTWMEIPGLAGLEPRSFAFTTGTLWVGTNDQGLYRTPWPPSP